MYGGIFKLSDSQIAINLDGTGKIIYGFFSIQYGAANTFLPHPHALKGFLLVLRLCTFISTRAFKVIKPKALSVLNLIEGFMKE